MPARWIERASGAREGTGPQPLTTWDDSVVRGEFAFVARRIQCAPTTRSSVRESRTFRVLPSGRWQAAISRRLPRGPDSFPALRRAVGVVRIGAVDEIFVAVRESVPVGVRVERIGVVDLR